MDLAYFNERYYLDKKCIKERDYILKMKDYFEEEREKDIINYSSLIRDYNLYLNSCEKLVNEIVATNDILIKMNVIRFLIMKGVFSHTDKFIRERDVENIIFTKSGINIIDGTGCCKHISEFISDVNSLASVLTTLYQSEEQYDDYANHAVNLIEYKGLPYVFDGNNNGTLYKFESPLILKSLNHLKCMYYKPYAEIVIYRKTFDEIEEFLEKNKSLDNKYITYLKELLLKYKAYLSVISSTSLISDFKSDTGIEVRNIKEQIDEIKERRK